MRNMLQKHGTKNSAHIQPYNCLPLEIFSSSVSSLDQALNSFLSTEYLGNTHVTSTQMSFEHLPHILTIQFARFRYSNDGTLQKNQKYISFPHSLKINKNHLSSKLQNMSNNSTKYSLFAGKLKFFFIFR